MTDKKQLIWGTRVIVPCFLCLFGFNALGAKMLSLDSALFAAKSACSGISDAMGDLKTMAGINTAVTAVGTVAGGVALGTGIAKSNVDKEQHDLMERVARLVEQKKGIPVESIEIKNKKIFKEQILSAIEQGSAVATDMKKISELEQKSKNLGAIRTGTLAASTATNIAGTAIAVNNKIDDDLEYKINKCISAVKDLSNAKLAAKVENTATDEQTAQADKIIANCRDWEMVDLAPINKRAKGAAVSSGIGIGTGVIGTITSAAANSDNTRNGNNQREKNLNATANVMAGASTAASAVATVFNATQIKAIKKAAIVADACEGALR